MNEIITLKELKGFVKLKKKNLPENWRVLVVNYLSHKQDLILRLRSLNRETFEQELGLVEAVHLAKRLGIVWQVSV
jgi:hypothetical protein